MLLARHLLASTEGSSSWDSYYVRSFSIDSGDRMGRRIYTVGHSSRSLEEFISLLHHYGVEVLVDVRRWPTSSRYPWFRREELSRVLGEHGIEYVWLGGLLGGYRSGGYEEYMRSREYEEGIRRLEEISRGRRVAIMCSEKLWFKCHRRFISDTLVARGYTVVHIIERGRTQDHRLRRRPTS